MGCDACAKLLGRVHETEIAHFVAEKFFCRASYLGIRDQDYGPKSEMPIKDDYDTNTNWITRSGFINLEFISADGRSIFYCHNNVNFHENMDYYRRLGLSEMVRAHTTYLSMGSDEVGSKIIKAIVEEFGGWYTPNDCSVEYTRIIGRREDAKSSIVPKRVDIELHVKTLGSRLNTPVYLLSACRVNLETANILETFGAMLDEDAIANLVGFVKTGVVQELPKFQPNEKFIVCRDEKSLMNEFSAWVNHFAPSTLTKSSTFLWSNGSLFHNRIVQDACIELGVNIPVNPANHRDIRTITAIAGEKCGFATEDNYRESIRMPKEKDDGFDDVRALAYLLSVSYDKLFA